MTAPGRTIPPRAWAWGPPASAWRHSMAAAPVWSWAGPPKAVPGWRSGFPTASWSVRHDVDPGLDRRRRAAGPGVPGRRDAGPRRPDPDPGAGPGGHAADRVRHRAPAVRGAGVRGAGAGLPGEAAVRGALPRHHAAAVRADAKPADCGADRGAHRGRHPPARRRRR